jgi:hypothetical protein
MFSSRKEKVYNWVPGSKRILNFWSKFLDKLQDFTKNGKLWKTHATALNN